MPPKPSSCKGVAPVFVLLNGVYRSATISLGLDTDHPIQTRAFRRIQQIWTSMQSVSGRASGPLVRIALGSPGFRARHECQQRSVGRDPGDGGTRV